MNPGEIDRLARAIGTRANRRTLLGVLPAIGLVSLAASGDDVEAKKKKKKKKKNPTPPAPPAPPPPPQSPPPPSPPVSPPPPPSGCDIQVSTTPQLEAALQTAFLVGTGYRICLAAGTYTLRPSEFESQDIELSGASLIGAGAEQTILRGSGAPDRTVIVNRFAASMSNLTVTGGRSSPGSGGGIANTGTLTLTNCIIRDNEAGYGGGIFNRGELTLDGCTITNNRAVTDEPFRGRGGGILNFETIIKTNTTISGNSADIAGSDNCFDDGGTGC